MGAIEPRGGAIFDPRGIICRIYVKLQKKNDDDSPKLGPVWIRGARLAGFIKRTTIHCYTQNMEVLGLEDFFMFVPL